MPRDVPEIQEGQQISSSKYLIPVAQTVNAVNALSGNVVMGPGGISIPEQHNRRNIRLPYKQAQATTTDDEEYTDGDVVMLVEQASSSKDILQGSDYPVSYRVEAPTTENQMKPIGIVNGSISSSSPGSVIYSGYALARVKWDVSDESLDPDDDDADKRYTEKTVGRLSVVDEYSDPESTILRVSLGAGVCDIVWESYDNNGDGTDDNDPTEEHWALVNISESLYAGADTVQVTEVDVDIDGTDYVKCKFTDQDGSAWGDEVLFRPVAGA